MFLKKVVPFDIVSTNSSFLVDTAEGDVISLVGSHGSIPIVTPNSAS